MGKDYEPDPELLDQYDNFYQTTKSLLVLFQIMGVMPIERSSLGKTTFRCYSRNLGPSSITSISTFSGGSRDHQFLPILFTFPKLFSFQ